MRKTFVAITVVMMLAAALALVIAATPAEPQAGPQPGWNLIAGTGQTPAVYAGNWPCVKAIYGWNAFDQSWRWWYRDVPTYVNTFRAIPVLNPAEGYWVYCEEKDADE